MPWPTNPSEQYFGRGLWAWVTDVWVKLVATAGGALHVYLAGQAVDVEVKQQTPGDLTPGIHGYDGAAWRKLSLLWGYTDRYAEQKVHTMTAGVTYSMPFTAVADGYVHRITGFSLTSSKNAAVALPYANFGGTLMVINPPHTVVANVYHAVSPFDLVLKKDDFIQFNWSGVAVNDVLVVYVWGYKMAVG